MKDRIKRFFIKDVQEVKDDSVEEKNVDDEILGEEELKPDKDVSDEEKQLYEYTLKDIVEIKDELGCDDVLRDILSEEFDVFSQSRSGSLAEKYEAFVKLKDIMKNIFYSSYNAAKEFGMENNLLAGANIAGFLKVADSMIAQGVAL